MAAKILWLCVNVFYISLSLSFFPNSRKSLFPSYYFLNHISNYHDNTKPHTHAMFDPSSELIPAVWERVQENKPLKYDFINYLPLYTSLTQKEKTEQFLLFWAGLYLRGKNRNSTIDEL